MTKTLYLTWHTYRASPMAHRVPAQPAGRLIPCLITVASDVSISSGPSATHRG